MSTTDEPRGDCFKAAFDHLMACCGTDLDGKTFTLVHGNLAHLPQDKEINHAWVEEGDMVHEVSNGLNKRLTKAEYYTRFSVTKTRMYSLMEAMRHIGDAGDYGAWDSTSLPSVSEA